MGRGALLVLAIAVVYAGSLRTPFHFDDYDSIVNNSTIRELGSWRWLTPPSTGGETVSGRPVLNFTFALNYALGGLDVRGYHVVNSLIHGSVAVLLMGLIGRSLRLRQGLRPDAVPDRSLDPRWLGFTVALLWALHPLQTAAVTYVVQRAESLAALFVVLTLYAFVRAMDGAEAGRDTGVPPVKRNSGRDAPAARTTARRWLAVSVGSCLLGMGTKETVFAAPVLVLLYDRAFVAGSFRAAWRARGRYYVALASAWLVLGGLVLTGGGRGGSAGFGAVIPAWDYCVTQAGAIVHYLRLVLWPAGQVFDAGVGTMELAKVWPQASLLLGLAGFGGWALVRNRVDGCLIATFFLLLAPSSSFVPIATQTMAEHRMYLPLAAVIMAVALAVRTLLGRLVRSSRGPLRESLGPARVSGFSGGERIPKGLFTSTFPPLTRRATVAAAVLVATAALALGAATVARNRVYQSELSLWQDTVAKRPDSPRAHHNLGLALEKLGDRDAAMAAYRRAIELQPNHAFAHCQLGVLLLERGQAAEAMLALQAALAADPGYQVARVNLGRALAALGRVDEAMAEYRAVLAAEPGAVDAQTNLAGLLIGRGQASEAVTLLREVIARHPETAGAHYHLGLALEKLTPRDPAAESAFREALRLQPEWAAAQRSLGSHFLSRGDLSGAETAYREAVRIEPQSAEAHYGLGNVLARRQAFAEAAEAFTEAVRLAPDHLQARNNLANCFLVTGRVQEAVATYEAILARRPDDATVRKNLEFAQELLRRSSSQVR